MACNSGNNIKQVQLNAKIVRNAMQCIELEPNVADNIDGAYLEISSKTVDYYFYINTNPVIAGKTGVAVTVASNATANQVAIAFETAINGMVAPKPFSVTRKNNHLVIKNNVSGEALQLPAITGFTVITSLTIISVGLDIDLGLLDGDVTPSIEAQEKDITAHQYGTTLVDKLITGITVTTELVLKEFDCAMKEAFYEKVYGSVYTDSGANKLLGIGSKLFGSINDKMVTLILSPVEPTNNECENWYIWKAFPSMPNEVYGAEDEKKATITFTSYVDRTKPTAIDIVALGLGEDLLNSVTT